MNLPSSNRFLPIVTLLACAWCVAKGQTLESDARLAQVGTSRNNSSGETASTSPSDMDRKLPPGIIRFEQSDLGQVLGIYQELSGRTVLQPASLPQVPITIRSQTEMSRQEAMELIESALALNGVVMIPLGEHAVKAVPMTQAWQEAVPMFEGSAEDLPDSGTYVLFPFRARHVKPHALAAAMQPFALNPQAIVAVDDANLILLRDLASNVRQMVRVAEMIDRPRGAAPTYGRRRGLLFLFGSVAGLVLARRLFSRGSWRMTALTWGSGVALGFLAMNMSRAAQKALLHPWSAEATGVLFIVLVPWLFQLYRQWMGRDLVEAHRVPGSRGVRAWLAGEQVVALLAVALLAAHGLGYSFWITLILGILVMVAYPVSVTLRKGRVGTASQQAEFRRSLQMLESGLLTPREFGHRVAVVYGKRETEGDPSPANANLKYEI